MNARSIIGPPTTLPQYQEDLHPVSPVPWKTVLDGQPVPSFAGS
jgi:hypothetical protein